MSDAGQGEVFLVSGGARGITAECVVGLAEARGGAYLLVGRTPLDVHPEIASGVPDDETRRAIQALLTERGEKATPKAIERVFKAVRAREEISRTIERITKAGGIARYAAADVTDGASLRAAIEAAGLGEITGVIHGAGMLADKRIEAKSDEDVASVFATKVQGLRALMSAVDESRLTHLALFSSTSGFHGNVGQSDYAAANEVLNKFAHAFHARFPGCRTVVFDWGPWDGGMVTPFLRSLFESNGVAVMPVETGVRAFVDVLCDPDAPVQVVVNDVGTPGFRADPTTTPTLRSPPPQLRVTRLFAVERNAFLRDHVINGHPVLPAASAGLWMANLCLQSNPAYRFAGLSDFRVLKGLVFDGAAADRYVAEVRTEAASEGALALSVVITSTTRDRKPRYHYRGTVRLTSERPDAPEPRRFELSADPALADLRPYEDGSLFHGPVFRAVQRVLRLGPRAITIECRAPLSPSEIHGQFPPAAYDAVLLDTQFQALGLWAHHTFRAAALPTGWGRYEVFESPAPGATFFVTAEIEGRSDYEVRATLFMHDADGRIFARAVGVEMTVHRAAPVTEPVVEPERPAPKAAPHLAPVPEFTASNRRVAFEAQAVARTLRDVGEPSFVLRSEGRVGVTRDRRRGETARHRGELLSELTPTPPARFGDPRFLEEYGVKSAYMAGAMAKGIASEELVIALGRAGYLGCFGAGGLSIERIDQAVRTIQAALPTEPHAFNLLHSPRKLATEDATVDVYLKHGVRTVEASSYVDLTPSIVRYRVAGLARRPDGSIERKNRVIVKLSRVELARRFMEPAPEPLVRQLLDAGRITQEQADLAPFVPLADDVTVEADSGGHTDNRPLVGVIPAMLALRDEVQRDRRYPTPVRVGAAGGIGTPHAVLAAFSLGADYVVTGSVNQSCIEAGTSDHVKQLLSEVGLADVAMSPESDMFEHGVKVQVVKLKTLYPMRAQKLYATYLAHDGLDAIPEPLRRQLEQQVFKDTLDSVWTQTEAHLAQLRPQELARAAADPKVKMALTFKWYLGQSSRWAAEGRTDRELDFQIWCGPAMGAFNAWARGTYLESPENRRVADVARVLMSEAAYLHRLQKLRLEGLSGVLGAEGAA